MSSRAALTERLRRLAAAGLSGGAAREFRDVDAADLVSELLFEADSIVLPRQLRIESDEGQGLTLEIANRRILRAQVPGSDAVPVIFFPSDPDAGRTLRGMVDAALGSGPVVRFGHAPLGREMDPAEPGISVRAVAEAWGVQVAPSGDKSTAEMLDAFLSEASDLLPAWVIVAEGASEICGEDDLIDGLVALAETGIAKRLRDRGGRDAWRFAAMGPFLEDAPFRAIGAVGETLFLMAIAPDALDEVAGHWRKAIG